MRDRKEGRGKGRGARVPARTSGQEHVQDDAARPDVSREAVVALVCEHLGGHIVGRATGRVKERRVVIGAVQRRQPEVGDLEHLALVQQEVLRLEIAVAHALLVAVLDAGYQLPEVLARGGLVEAPHVNNLVEELTARDELEHDEDFGPRREHLQQVHHVLLLHHLHDRDLLLDLLAHVLLLDLLLVEDLDRDALVGFRVHRELDLAERALAERAPDLVLPHLFDHSEQSVGAVRGSEARHC